jgi:hypothetical protein
VLELKLKIKVEAVSDHDSPLRGICGLEDRVPMRAGTLGRVYFEFVEAAKHHG